MSIALPFSYDSSRAPVQQMGWSGCQQLGRSVWATSQCIADSQTTATGPHDSSSIPETGTSARKLEL